MGDALRGRPRINKRKVLLWGRPAGNGGDEVNNGTVVSTDDQSTAGFQYSKAVAAGEITEITVTITVQWDKTPSFASGHSARLNKVLEVATNKLLEEKVISPGESPSAVLDELKDMVQSDDYAKYARRYGVPETPGGGYNRTAIFNAIMREGNLAGQGGGPGTAGNLNSYEVAGPLTGIRVGNLGRVTRISGKELASTSADDYGLSIDAIDGSTRAYEYDMGISDSKIPQGAPRNQVSLDLLLLSNAIHTLYSAVVGARFNDKLEAMVNGIICCILSSASGYMSTGTEPEGAQGGLGDRINSGISDPTVLALWAGDVNPTTRVREPGLPFASDPTAVDYGAKLLKSGCPRIEPPVAYTFLQKCIDVLLQNDGANFFETRIPLKRADLDDRDPSAISYPVSEICFGPKQAWLGPPGSQDAHPLRERAFMFGTGFSTTLGAEVVQIAGSFIEERALLENEAPGAAPLVTAETTISFLGFEEVANFIRESQVTLPKFIAPHVANSKSHRRYIGYVHLRHAELRRPVFACIVNSFIAENIQRVAEENHGARNGREIGEDATFGRLLGKINRLSYGAEGEALRRLVEPYLVRVSTTNPYNVATLMHYDQWFLPTTLFSSIETQCCAEILHTSHTRPKKFNRREGQLRQPTDTVAARIRSKNYEGELTFEKIYNLTRPNMRNALEGHIISLLMSVNRFDDVSTTQFPFSYTTDC